MRPLRNRSKDLYRLLTLRTARGEFWITPSRNVEKIIGGIISRYQELYEIEIYCYKFLSNHYHMIVRAPKSNVDEFCESVNREITRRLNWKHKRTGSMWSRRYDDQAILSHDDLLEAFLYVTTNSVKHGLVEHCSDWTGLSSYNQSLTERNRKFSFDHYSAREGEERVSKHELKLTPLPQFKDMTIKARTQKLRTLLEERIELLQSERRSNGQGFLGMSMILDQSPGEVPLNMSVSPRPKCYTKCAKRRKGYIKLEKYRRRVYSECSFRFRLGDMNVEFPEGTYKPPLHRKSRYFSFQPLGEEALKRVV